MGDYILYSLRPPLKSIHELRMRFQVSNLTANGVRNDVTSGNDTLLIFLPIDQRHRLNPRVKNPAGSYRRPSLVISQALGRISNEQRTAG